MEQYFTKRNLILLLVLILAAGIIFFLPRKKPDVELTEKQQVLVDLKVTGEKEDYAAFAQNLKIAYDRNWVGEPGTPEGPDDPNKNQSDYIKVESKIYVNVYNQYFLKEDYNKSLEISTLVYDQVPLSWRFRYLRILSLEKLGRLALEKGDLDTAQTHALTILQIMFRTEGANLLADVYIKKLEADIKTRNRSKANADYIFIKDYEVSADRMDKLNQLKAQIDKL